MNSEADDIEMGFSDTVNQMLAERRPKLNQSPFRLRGSQGSPVAFNVLPGETRQYGLADVFIDGGDEYANGLSMSWGFVGLFPTFDQGVQLRLILQYGSHGSQIESTIDFRCGGSLQIPASRCRVILEVSNDVAGPPAVAGNASASFCMGASAGEHCPLLTSYVPDRAPGSIGTGLGQDLDVPRNAKRMKVYVPDNLTDSVQVVVSAFGDPASAAAQITLHIPAGVLPEWIDLPNGAVRVTVFGELGCNFTTRPFVVWEIDI